MTATITLIISIINGINIFLKKNAKLISLLMFLLLVILMGANTDNPDIYSYKFGYSSDVIDNLEFGYSILEKIFFNLGITYEIFRIVISGMGILLINQTVKKARINISAFYLLYFIYPFMLDVVQTKNFLVMAIFIYSIPYLLSDEKRDLFKYLILILIAVSIHWTALVYLPLIIFVRLKKNIFIKVLIFDAIISLIFISLNGSLLSYVSLILENILGVFDVRIFYYAHRQTNLGFLLYWFMQFINFFILYRANKYLNNVSTQQVSSKNIINLPLEKQLKANDFQYKYVSLVFWINIYAFMFLPFYLFQSTFSRFMRNIIPLNLSVYILTSQNLPSKSYKNIKFTLTYIIYNLFLFYVDIYRLYNFNIVEKILKHNWILK